MADNPEAVFKPLYTMEEAAAIAQIPVDTVAEWAQPPEFIVSLDDPGPEQPSLTFIGMAELLVLATINPDQEFLEHFYPALPFLEYKFGRKHPMAHYWFKHDGPKLLWEYYNLHSSPEQSGKLLYVHGDYVRYVDVINNFLFWSDYHYKNKYMHQIRLPQFATATVFMDTDHHSGSPYFKEGGNRVDEVVNAFLEGQSLQDCSVEYDVPVFHIEDVLKNKDKPMHNPAGAP